MTSVQIEAMLDAAGIYSAAARAGAKPDPDLNVSDWADANRMLSSRSSPEPGPWRTARTPYLRAIMDDLSPHSRVETVVFMKGAQIGATEAGNNWTAFNIVLAPGPMMVVQPTTEMAKRNSRQRLAPLIEESPALRNLVKDTRSKDSGNTILSKEFPGGILVMVGANSAKGLRSMSARYLFLDEVDGYPGDVDGEGEPCDLAITRTRNYARRKVFIASTPTVTGRSRIERFFENTDQNYYFVPCPRCGHMQVLEVENLHWPKGKPQEAVYHCEGCEKPIQNHQKEYMLPRGEWRPMQPDRFDGKTRGYHLSSMYSPVGWFSWPDIAEMREKASGDREKLQVFWNTILGLPWADQGEVPEPDRLYERREAYKIGTVPEGGLLLTCGVDVQMRRLECEVVAWGRNRESWSVDYRVIEGDTSQPEVWQQLELLLDEDFPTVYGRTTRIERMAVDTGFQTLSVYEFVRKMSAHRVMAIKGDSRTAAVVGHPSMIEVGPQGRPLKYGIRLWPMNVSLAKEELYRNLKTSMPDLEKGEAWPAGYCHFPAYSKEFFDQLCGEQLITRVIRGLRRSSWEKIRERNEALDTRIYARGAAAALRIETWSAAKWDEIEAGLTLERAQEKPRRAPALRQTTISAPPAFTAFKPKESPE